MENTIDFTRINNDTFGNPRYVCHYLNFLTEADKDIPFDQRYKLALKRAKQLQGGKFHNKQYGGGIVFQTYNIEETERRIKELLAKLNQVS